MTNCKSVYDPQEDSTMLERYVGQFAKGKVLDVGTGSGIQAIAAAQKNDVESVLAVDVQKGVIDYCIKCIKNKKIRFMQSDLFSKVRGKFDVIVFNPPYLPQDLKLGDLTIEGGKKGYEVIERFLNDVNRFLMPEGKILLVFSSLTKKEKVGEFMKNNLFDFEELERQHIFFEDIFVYLLRKNALLKKIECKNVFGVKYFAKGKRGLLFTGLYNGKKVVIKMKNPKSQAIGRIENEINWLKKLNKVKIGPKLLLADRDYFVYEHIEGCFINDYIKKSAKHKIRKLIKEFLEQLYMLDKMHLDKEEMHHPVKHIIVRKDKPYLIDFERCHYSARPKNITQFCQFIIGLSPLLEKKGIKIEKDEVMRLAKVYKSNPNRANFDRIANLV